MSKRAPADKAGLRGGTSTVAVEGAELPVGGDIIVAVDGRPVKSFNDLTSYLFTKTKTGQTVKLTVLRDGKQQDIQATLAPRPHAAS